MQVICKLLFVWRRKLVLSSSSRLCQTWHWSGCLSRILHDWWKLKRRQIKLFEITIQNTGKQTTQKFSSQEPRWNSSATTAQQFKGNTSAATSGLHCNLMLHTTVQSVFVTPFPIQLQHPTALKKCLLCLFKERKLFSRNNCVHMHTHKKQIQRVIGNYIAQHNNLEIWFKISIVAELIGLLCSHVN
jgi:hypothetical protein